MKKMISIYAVIMTVFVSVSFVVGSFVYPRLEAWSGLKVAPEFSGGEALYEFRDAYGDDTGEGAYVYPAHPLFEQKGLLDILKYTVYEPQIFPRWQESGPYWQLAVTLAAMHADNSSAAGFAGPTVSIFLESAALTPPAWEIRIDGAHKKARMLGTKADGTAISWEIPLVVIPEQRILHVRVPLDRPETEALLGGASVQHAVTTAVYDPFAPEERQQVKRTATLSSGGGASSRDSSRFWDMLIPIGTASPNADQAALLTENKPFAVTTGLPGRAYLGLGGLPVDRKTMTGSADAEELKRLAGEAEEAHRQAQQEMEQQLQEEGISRMKRGTLLFRLGRTAEAEEIFLDESREAPDAEKPLLLAYRGCLTAMQGGEKASPAEAMKLVFRGWDLLNESVELAGKEAVPPAILMETLICRGNVAVSVPQGVFGFSEQGAADFERAAALAAQIGNAGMQAELQVRAAQAWEQTGNKDQAELAWIKAGSLKEHSAAAALECVKRGY